MVSQELTYTDVFICVIHVSIQMLIFKFLYSYPPLGFMIGIIFGTIKNRPFCTFRPKSIRFDFYLAQAIFCFYGYAIRRKV